MDTLELYKLWLEKATDDPDLIAELSALDPEKGADAIFDRFYRDLEFGTGGLRGVIGAGSNRMNVYTVGRATRGLAKYLNIDVTVIRVIWAIAAFGTLGILAYIACALIIPEKPDNTIIDAE